MRHLSDIIKAQNLKGDRLLREAFPNPAAVAAGLVRPGFPQPALQLRPGFPQPGMIRPAGGARATC